MAKESNNALVVRLMNENKEKTPDEVIDMILAQISFPPRVLSGNTDKRKWVRGYYMWGLKNGGVGFAPLPTVKPKTEKVKAEPKVKVAKGPMPKKDKPAGPVKTDEEIAAIKEANLNRMREVAAKMKNRKVVEVADSKEEDRQERERFRIESDHPEFLMKEELRNLGV